MTHRSRAFAEVSSSRRGNGLRRTEIGAEEPMADQHRTVETDSGAGALAAEFKPLVIGWFRKQPLPLRRPSASN